MSAADLFSHGMAVWEELPLHVSMAHRPYFFHHLSSVSVCLVLHWFWNWVLECGVSGRGVVALVLPLVLSLLTCCYTV